MKLQFQKNDIYFANKSFVVLMPTFELTQTYVIKVDKEDFMLFGNEGDLVKLSFIFTLASQKKNTLIYLPTKKNESDRYLQQTFGREMQDVLLLHHQLQFPLKDWKVLRQKCKHGELISYEMSERGSSGDVEDVYTHHLLIKNQFDTAFMVGSKPIFQMLSQDCKEVSEKGPAVFKKEGKEGYHYHAHLDRYLRKGRGKGNMCIDYYEI